MNWMIDGANGDLYRTAMGYPAQREAADEWEIERTIGRKPHHVRNPFEGLLPSLAERLALARETIRLALTSKETVS
jgi:hypothetical protein